MTDADFARLREHRDRPTNVRLQDVTRFEQILDRLEDWGLCPVRNGCRYLRDPDSGQITGLHLTLGFREGVDDWLVKVPFHLSWALRKFGYGDVGEPHLCNDASWFLRRRVVAIRARRHRRKAA